jgi:hypothetical protein
VLSYKDGDKSGYFNSAKTDKNGRFYLRGGELPDSTGFIVSAELRKGLTRMNLIIDEETFPSRTLPAVPPPEIDKIQFAQYAEKAEQQYTSESGMRIYYLPEVTVTAERKPPIQSVFYSIKRTSSTLTEEMLDQLQPTNIYTMFMWIPGVIVNGTAITISGSFSTGSGEALPLILVDDAQVDYEYLDRINVNDIAQVDILRPSEAFIFGMRGAHGAISIFTKTGKRFNKREIPPFHIKSYLPLGYQQPVEFYAPKYDTPEKRNTLTPDLRTTLHWQPVVEVDSMGNASFQFYTADNLTSYTVIIEGLTNDGRIIRHESKLFQEAGTVSIAIPLFP